MVQLPIPVSLRNCQSGSNISAQLIELTAKLAKSKIDGAWWGNLGVSRSRRRQEGDHGWNWANRMGALRGDLFVEAVAVQTEDQDIQAAMIYRLDALSILAPGNGAVYVDRLATAPRNHPGLAAQPLYRGAGTAAEEDDMVIYELEPPLAQRLIGTDPSLQ